MQISVAIKLEIGDEFTMSPEDAAAAILDLFEDTTPENDYCSVQISLAQQGAAGFVPPPLPPPGAVQLPTLPEVTPLPTEPTS